MIALDYKKVAFHVRWQDLVTSSCLFHASEIACALFKFTYFKKPSTTIFEWLLKVLSLLIGFNRSKCEVELVFNINYCSIKTFQKTHWKKNILLKMVRELIMTVFSRILAILVRLTFVKFVLINPAYFTQKIL